MKTLVLSMISIAATLAAMTACTSEGDPIDEIDNGQPVEIKMSAGVLNIETKSSGPISGLTGDIDNVMFVKVDAAKDVTDDALNWGTNPTKHKATIAKTSGDITFTDKAYYSSDADIYSYLIGYHPNTEGTSSGSEVSYTIDGKMDIMISTVVKGNKNSKETALTPQFSHKLTQLIVWVQGDEAAATAWGTITNIKVKDIKQKVILDLSTKELKASTTDNTPNSLEITHTTYPTIETEAKEAGYCMILPKTTADAYTLEVTTDVTTKEVTVDIPASADGTTRAKNTTVAGESYKINLTFKANEISAKASVDTWIPSSEEGAGNVD